MNNTKYNYPDMYLWEDKYWEGRQSCLMPLIDQIIKNDRPAREDFIPKSRWIGRTDGIYDPKPLANTYPEVTEYWKNNGMDIFLKEMGSFLWMALVPSEIVGQYGNKRDVLLVVCEADYNDPNWAMDILDRYSELCEKAAKTGTVLTFTTSNFRVPRYTIGGPLHETLALWHIDPQNFCLDVSNVPSLKDVPGFTLRTPDGDVIEDPDAEVTTLLDRRVLSIDGIWTATGSILRGSYVNVGSGTTIYRSEDLIHSLTGKRIAECLRWEHKYTRCDDPGLIEEINAMGLDLGFHTYKGEQWLSIVPKETHGKLPVVLILQEVPSSDMHSGVGALSLFKSWLELSAQGECILLFFALETKEDNYMFVEILDEAEKIYPIDDTRVYMTGHSHNGYYTADVMRKFPNRFAAIATLGNTPGLPDPEWFGPVFSIPDEDIEYMSTFDMPTINIDGLCEHVDMFPLWDYPSRLLPMCRTALDTPEKRAISWQRRLKASRCPVCSIEDVLATKDSDSKVERLTGIPADRNEIQFLDGIECYISDIKNVDGKYHLRHVVFDNMPHVYTPLMCEFGWGFMRRFARDPETHEIIELY